MRIFDSTSTAARLAGVHTVVEAGDLDGHLHGFQKWKVTSPITTKVGSMNVQYVFGRAMKRAHRSIVLSSGGDIAFGEMLVRLPLSPQDHDVVSLCSEVAGWTDEFLDACGGSTSGGCTMLTRAWKQSQTAVCETVNTHSNLRPNHLMSARCCGFIFSFLNTTQHKFIIVYLYIFIVPIPHKQQ